jgi:hypothetical protein
MKEQIEELIQQYKESRKEIWSLLEELSQVELTKLTTEENNSLRESIIRYEEEYYLYGNIITDLENSL